MVVTWMPLPELFIGTVPSPTEGLVTDPTLQSTFTHPREATMPLVAMRVTSVLAEPAVAVRSKASITHIPRTEHGISCGKSRFDRAGLIATLSYLNFLLDSYTKAACATHQYSALGPF